MAVDIGDFLRKQRTRKELTQKEVADFVGVTEATVSRWESGEIGNMRRDRIAKLAAILNISPLHLMGDINDPNHPWHDYSKPDVHEYYTDPETALLAQEAHDNPDLRILFDASRKLSPKDLKTVTALVRSLTEGKDG